MVKNTDFKVETNREHVRKNKGSVKNDEEVHSLKIVPCDSLFLFQKFLSKY